MVDALGNHVVCELKHGGSHIPVSAENLFEYACLLADFKCRKLVKDQLKPLVEGFNAMIPQTLIQHMLTPEEFKQVLTSAPKVDVEDLIAYLAVEGLGFALSSPQMVWLCEALRSYSQQDLRHFIEFVTGSPNVPLGGFRNLRDVNRNRCKMTIYGISTRNGNMPLPTSRTCSTTLYMPPYSTRVELGTKLKIAIDLAHRGFGLV